ncbi:MAG TPA: hypothetical protein VHQ24_11105 [Lachnospiraceae bacterium]|nr:hypothetical protein [Lachnospiraceae bacterium]
MVGEFKDIHGLLQLEDSTEYLAGIMEEQYKHSIALFLHEFKDRKQVYKQEFMKVIDQVLLKGIEKQENGRKERIAYICIFFLKSSIMTSSYQMQINLYDQNLYMDRNDVFTKWDTTFLMKYFENDIAVLNRMAKQRIYHWGYKEYQLLTMEYVKMYMDLLELYCADFIRDMLLLESYDRINKEDTVKVYYGGYLNQLHCIYPLEVPKEG